MVRKKERKTKQNRKNNKKSANHWKKNALFSDQFFSSFFCEKSEGEKKEKVKNSFYVCPNGG